MSYCIPRDSGQSLEFYGSEAIASRTVCWSGPLCLCVQVGASRGVRGCSWVLCEEVMVFVMERFPLWWLVGMPAVNRFPCFLREVEYLFDACGNGACDFVS